MQKSTKQKNEPDNGQKRTTIRGGSSSSKASTGTGSGNRTANASQDYPKWTVYTSIRELKLDKFIDCTCNKNYKALVIEGDPDTAALGLAWVDICSQYQEARDSAQDGNRLDKMTDIGAFEIKEMSVTCMLLMLTKVRDQRIIEELQEEGYDYPFTEETYAEDIEKVQAELASEKMQIELYQQQMQDVGRSEQKDTDFYKTLALLQKELGVCTGMGPILMAKELTVYDFALYCNMYEEHIKIKTKDGKF